MPSMNIPPLPDYTARWRALVDEREAQAARLRAAASMSPPAFWDERAEGFRRAVQRRATQADPVFDLVASNVDEEMTVLDVGAGVGRHALPLSWRVKHVTAVEPAHGMRELLLADAEAQHVANLTVVGATWEAAEAPPADVVLCSHVVYNVPDIGLFVDKLAGHTGRACFIVMRTGQRDRVLRPLFQQVHGEELVPEPTLIDLYNVVHQRLGIAANVQAVAFRRGTMPLGAYESLDEGVASLRQSLYVAEGSAGEAQLRAFLQQHLMSEDGRLVLASPAIGAGILWWDATPGSDNRV